MGVAEEAGSAMTKRYLGEWLVSIRALANRKVSTPALLAFAADNRERHDYAVSDLQLTLCASANFDHFTHRLVAENIAFLHPRQEMIEQVEVRAADGATRHFDNSIPILFDFRIGNA